MLLTVKHLRIATVRWQIKSGLDQVLLQCSNYRSMLIQEAQINHIENYVCIHTHLHIAGSIHTPTNTHT